MKYLMVWLGLGVGCGGPPILPVGLPPPEYERPPIPSGGSAGGEARAESSPGGTPSLPAGESATPGSAAAGGSAGAGGSTAGAWSGSSP